MYKTNLILFFFIINSFICLNSEETVKIEKVKFGHEVEKIKPHPKAEFETLKNGFRYVLLPNKTPEKRVLVYLYVDSGSLNETDKQQGLAHYLEHMAFNGTKNFPGESLIDFFKKMGMSFGGDTNAHTSFDETVYKLNLPEDKFRDDAVKIMADYAMNMLLTKEEVEKERGIILSEKRARDTIDSRIWMQNINFLLPDNLIPKRLPIGIEETIKAAQQEDLLDYYNQWYRPENMVLVVVGDIEPKPWHKIIEKSFKNIKSKVSPIAKYTLSEVIHKGLKINYYFEKEASDTNIEINTVTIKKQAKLGYKEQTRIQLAENAALQILNERLREKISQKNNPFHNAMFQVYNWLDEVNRGSLVITCKPENWKASLIFAENELRKALDFGFTDQEVLLFKKDYINRLDKAVSTMATVNSSTYMNQILRSISSKTPFLDAIQDRELEKPLIEQLTKEDILKEFKKYWLVDHRLVTVSGNAEINNAESEIKKALAEATLLEVAKQNDETLVTFPFESKPEIAGKIAKQEEFKELDFKRITFENNVVLNLKKTAFNKNEINFNIGFGRGIASLPKNKEHLVHLAALAFNEGGLTKLSKTELKKALTGKNVSAQFSVGTNTFLLQSNTTPTDFETNLQLCRAKILFPGFREEATEVLNKYIEQRYSSLASNIQDYFRNSLYKVITNNNPSITLPAKSVIESITLAEIKEWLTGQFLNASIEINVVGDVDEKQVIDLVALYFGSLPEREKIISPLRKKIYSAKVFNETEDFKTTIKKAYVFMSIPTTDFREIEEVRKINLLSRVLGEKVRKVIREKLSISYSPGIGHNTNKDYKDSCYLQMTADVDLQNIEVAKNAFDSIIKETAENGVSAAELDAVRGPLLTQVKTTFTSNGYWLDRVLSDSTAEPENLKIAETLQKGYENITHQQLTETAKKYLILENRSVFVLKSVSDMVNVKLEPTKEEEK
jgi:zinc protease